MNTQKFLAALDLMREAILEETDPAAPPAPASRPRAKNIRRRRLPVVPASVSVSDSDRAAARRALGDAGVLRMKR